MRKKTVRWLQVNVFLNPFIPDLQPVGKPGSWRVDFYWEKKKYRQLCNGYLYTEVLCIFNILVEEGEPEWSANIWGRLEWLKNVKSLYPFLFRGRQREVFVLLLQSCGRTYCVLFVAVLPKRCPPFYL